MTGTIELESQIHDALKRFTEAVDGVTAEVFVIRPEIGGWSISEVVEHVAIANRNILAILERRLELLAGPPDIIDDEMPYLFYGGEEPPNVGTPTGTWTDLDGALGELEASSDRLVEWARGSTADLRAVGARHPVFGALDAAQWLRFSAVHMWRHRTQMMAVHRAVTG